MQRFITASPSNISQGQWANEEGEKFHLARSTFVLVFDWELTSPLAGTHTLARVISELSITSTVISKTSTDLYGTSDGSHSSLELR